MKELTQIMHVSRTLMTMSGTENGGHFVAGWFPWKVASEMMISVENSYQSVLSQGTPVRDGEEEGQGRGVIL